MASGLPMSAFDTMVVPDAEGWMEVSFVAPAEQFWMAIGAEKLGATSRTTAYIDDISLREGWIVDKKCPLPGSIYANKNRYRWGFNTQEMVDEIKGVGNHYTAEFWEYDPRLGRRWNLDPVPVPWESGYVANRNNPISLNDPYGDCPDCENDEYQIQKGDNFWNLEKQWGLDHGSLAQWNPGVDPEKLQIGQTVKAFGVGDNGNAVYVDNKFMFRTQDEYSELPNINVVSFSSDEWNSRPDNDGIVTPKEGIQWAKMHPNLKAPGDGDGVFSKASPKDFLYLDASKMNFGSLSIRDFSSIGKEQFINLFNYKDGKATWPTIYALGRTYITLLDDKGTVRVSNGKWNAFDWSYGGKLSRNVLIWQERIRNGLNDSHGFPLLIYGTGILNK